MILEKETFHLAKSKTGFLPQTTQTHRKSKFQLIKDKSMENIIL